VYHLVPNILHDSQKPEVQITFLQLQILYRCRSIAEMALPIKSRTHGRQWATPSSAEYQRWWAIPGSGDNLAISRFFKYCRRFKPKTGLCMRNAHIRPGSTMGDSNFQRK